MSSHRRCCCSQRRPIVILLGKVDPRRRIGEALATERSEHQPVGRRKGIGIGIVGHLDRGGCVASLEGAHREHALRNAAVCPGRYTRQRAGRFVPQAGLRAGDGTHQPSGARCEFFVLLEVAQASDHRPYVVLAQSRPSHKQRPIGRVARISSNTVATHSFQNTERSAERLARLAIDLRGDRLIRTGE